MNKQYELSMIVNREKGEHYAFSEHETLQEAIEVAQKSFRDCYITDVDIMKIVWIEGELR